MVRELRVWEPCSQAVARQFIPVVLLLKLSWMQSDWSFFSDWPGKPSPSIAALAASVRCSTVTRSLILIFSWVSRLFLAWPHLLTLVESMQLSFWGEKRAEQLAFVPERVMGCCGGAVRFCDVLTLSLLVTQSIGGLSRVERRKKWEWCRAYG